MKLKVREGEVLEILIMKGWNSNDVNENLFFTILTFFLPFVLYSLYVQATHKDTVPSRKYNPSWFLSCIIYTYDYIFIAYCNVW